MNDTSTPRFCRLAAATVLAGQTAWMKACTDAPLDEHDHNFVVSTLGDLDRDDLYGVIAALSAMVGMTIPPDRLRAVIGEMARREIGS